MSRFAIELATERHDSSLRQLFASNSMKGEIEISFRREPNYFHAAQTQGPFFQTFVYEEQQTREVVGVGTRAIRPGFLNGRTAEIGYLGDLRLDSHVRGGLLIARAYRHLAQLHRDGRTRLYFTVIADGNQQALATIASGRAGIPLYQDWGRIHSPAINLLRRMPSLDPDLEIIRADAGMLPEIVDCLNRNNQKRQFAPFYRVEDFKSSDGWLRDFSPSDFYVARRDGRVIGVLGKWDQGAYKQTVVTRYSLKLRLMALLFNFAAPWIGCARYPSIGTKFDYFYASFIAIDEDNVPVFRALLRTVYNDHAGSKYNYFLVGLHERDPLAAALTDFVLTPFTARLFTVHFEDGHAIYESLDRERVPYIELAML
jgi:hypothetical protein